MYKFKHCSKISILFCGGSLVRSLQLRSYFSTRTKHQIDIFMILGLKCLKWYTSKNVRLIFFLPLLEPMLSLFGEWTFIFEWHQLSDKCFLLIRIYINEMSPFRQNSTLKAHKFKVLLILIYVSLRYLKVVLYGN